jgi:hypothetical protein
LSAFAYRAPDGEYRAEEIGSATVEAGVGA